MTPIEIALDARATLGEAPVWDSAAECLWWVDVVAGEVHRFHPATGADTFVRVGQDVGAIALRRSGGLVAGVRDGVVGVGPDGAVQRIADLEPELPGNRCNDGKCDSAGRFWVGTMSTDESGRPGSLYRLGADGDLTVMVTGLHLSNGLGWSPDDRTMYLIDTEEQAVDAFDFDARTGDLDARRRLVTIEDDAGSPDGMSVDAAGGLWIALYGGGSVRRYAPTGQLEEEIVLPVRQPTCPTFGGVDLGDLYVTSARQELSAADLSAAPDSGAVLRLRPGARGMPPNAFAG